MQEICKGIWVGSLDDCLMNKKSRLVKYTVHLGDYLDPDRDSKKQKNDQYNHYHTIYDCDDHANNLLEIMYMEDKFISNAINDGGVFIHCHAGVSRSASLALLYMFHHELVFSIDEFKRMYPMFFPNMGFQDLFKRLQIPDSVR